MITGGGGGWAEFGTPEIAGLGYAREGTHMLKQAYYINDNHWVPF